VTAADYVPPALLTAKPSWLLTQTAAHSHRLLAARMAEAGARGYHIRVLASLAEFGPASQAGLGRRIAMDRSDITAAVNELAAGDLVERTADAGDRRRNVITITEAGRARLAQLDEITNGLQDELFAPLSADERAALARLLRRVLDYQNGRTPQGTPEPG
jgi:MarR family transcriptional regulator, lower aerobic nicotinate degradation pathway regulator